MTATRFELVFTAEAEVDRPGHDHVQECVAAHPGAPCPGYPHEEKEVD